MTDLRRAAVAVETNLAMRAPDGVQLRADIYRPRRASAAPVLLHRTPYGRHQANYREMAEAIASRGYVVVVQDLRGRFDSEGEFVPMWIEGRLDGSDGARAVAWAQGLAGTLPAVGMYGVSYDASVQWETAALRPAGLRSILPGGMMPSSLSTWPGVFRVGRQLKWALMLAADTRRRLGMPPPHTRAESEQLWHSEAGRWMWNVPLAAIPEERLGGMAPYWQAWFDRHRDDFYHYGGIPALIPDVAIGLVTGWHDRCLDTVDFFTAAQATPRTAATELTVGPWSHGYARPRVVGDVDFGPGAEHAYADEAVDWFDRTLRPIVTPGARPGPVPAPRVRIFVMGANSWRELDRWPPTTTPDLALHLGPGTLSAAPPAGQGVLEFSYDPRDPVPSTYSADYQDAPMDQRILDGRRDIVRFETPPLDAPVETIGKARLILHASSDAPDTDWPVKLLDVEPDGRAVNVATGMVRARWRDGFDAPRPLIPGEVVAYEIRLRATANRFAAGHRIRLDVTSSDFPNFDRNHNTGGDDPRSAVFAVARQALWYGGRHPSRLELPVVAS